MKTMLKDYSKEISYNSYNNFVDYASNKGYDIDIIEGDLNDTYIIHNPERTLSLKGVKGREFIVLYPKFQNSWSNTLHILLTDNEDTVNEFLKED